MMIVLRVLPIDDFILPVIQCDLEYSWYEMCTVPKCRVPITNSSPPLR